MKLEVKVKIKIRDLRSGKEETIDYSKKIGGDGIEGGRRYLRQLICNYVVTVIGHQDFEVLAKKVSWT